MYYYLLLYSYFRCSQMNESETTRLIEDYCIHRIRKESIELANFHHVSRDPFAPVAARMREIGEKMLKIIYPGRGGSGQGHKRHMINYVFFVFGYVSECFKLIINNNNFNLYSA